MFQPSKDAQLNNLLGQTHPNSRFLVRGLSCIFSGSRLAIPSIWTLCCSDWDYTGKNAIVSRIVSGRHCVCSHIFQRFQSFSCHYSPNHGSNKDLSGPFTLRGPAVSEMREASYGNCRTLAMGSSIRRVSVGIGHGTTSGLPCVEGTPTT